MEEVKAKAAAKPFSTQKKPVVGVKEEKKVEVGKGIEEEAQEEIKEEEVQLQEEQRIKEESKSI